MLIEALERFKIMNQLQRYSKRSTSLFEPNEV